MVFVMILSSGYLLESARCVSIKVVIWSMYKSMFGTSADGMAETFKSSCSQSFVSLFKKSPPLSVIHCETYMSSEADIRRDIRDMIAILYCFYYQMTSKKIFAVFSQRKTKRISLPMEFYGRS